MDNINFQSPPTTNFSQISQQSTNYSEASQGPFQLPWPFWSTILASIFFGSISGLLITWQNLKRVGEKELSRKFIIIGGFLAFIAPFVFSSVFLLIKILKGKVGVVYTIDWPFYPYMISYEVLFLSVYNFILSISFPLWFYLKQRKAGKLQAKVSWSILLWIIVGFIILSLLNYSLNAFREKVKFYYESRQSGIDLSSRTMLTPAPATGEKEGTDTTFESKVGYSFQKPADIKINELGCHLGEFKEDPIYGSKRIIPYTGDNISEIQDDNFGMIWVAEYGKTAKTLPDEEIEKIHQGEYTCLKFFGDFQPVVDEVIRLNKLNQLQSSTKLESSPIAKSFNLTSYNNDKSGLYGVSFYNIGGYATPGLSKSKYYYLLSKDNKYFVQVEYEIPDSSCDELIKIEEQASSSVKSGKFIEGDYNAAVKKALPECDKIPPAIQQFLDTFSGR